MLQQNILHQKEMQVLMSFSNNVFFTWNLWKYTKYYYIYLMIHWSKTIFKVYKFGKFIQYAIHWNKTQILKNFSSDKINVTKYALFFISRALALNAVLRIIPDFCTSWSTSFISSMCGIFHIRFCLVFVEVFTFLFSRKHVLFDFQTS